MREMLTSVLNKVKNANNVYIYGTGKNGKRCFEWLKLKRIMIKAFIETDSKKQDYLGIPVYSSPDYLYMICELENLGNLNENWQSSVLR